MSGVNTLFNALTNVPEFAALDFSSLRVAVAGGAAIQSEVARRWRDITGSQVVEGYGLTEASPVVCINPFLTPKLGTVGLPVPSTEVTIRDDAGKVLGVGEEGEVWVRGPQVMQGYWQQPDETDRVLSADGWLRTGDIGAFDAQGYLKLLDRKKDMVNVSGFKVFPNEVEDVAMQHPRRARSRGDRRAGSRAPGRRSSSSSSNAIPSSTKPTSRLSCTNGLPLTKGRPSLNSPSNCRRAISARFCAKNCTKH